ncbi:hypothetical protein Tco_0212538 [Tanacetum coccineum]
MVKNLDNVSGKFLMYPRFVQVFLNQQLGDLSTHNAIYIVGSHTKKIFANMRRPGKGFSGRETPLFQTVVVQAQADMGKGSANPTDPHHIPTITQHSSSQPQKKQQPRKPSRKNTKVPQPSGSPDNEVGSSSRVESSKQEESLGEEDASKQRRKIAGIDADAGITLVDETAEIQGRTVEDEHMFDLGALNGEEVFAAAVQKDAAKEDTVVVEETDSVPVSAAGGETTVITEVKITLAQALAELKSAKPMTNKVVIQEPEQGATTTKTTTTTATITTPRPKGVVIQESEETTTKTTTIVPFQKSKDKGKAIMIEHEVPLKKKSQERADEETARNF